MVVGTQKPSLDCLFTFHTLPSSNLQSAFVPFAPWLYALCDLPSCPAFTPCLCACCAKLPLHTACPPPLHLFALPLHPAFMPIMPCLHAVQTLPSYPAFAPFMPCLCVFYALPLHPAFRSCLCALQWLQWWWGHKNHTGCEGHKGWV